MVVIKVYVKIFLLAIIILGAFLCSITIGVIHRRFWHSIVRYYAKAILWVSGINVHINGKDGCNYFEGGLLVVANHISWIDVMVLYSIRWVEFVARAEMKSWPIMGRILNSCNIIYVNRSTKKNLLDINNTISHRLTTGASVCVFPESKTSDGLQLLSFKPALLESAIIAGATILPVVIKYTKPNGNIATEVTYQGDITLWQTVKNTLSLNNVTVTAIVLDKVNAKDFTNRDELTNFLFNKINNIYRK